ncbi:protein kinase [Hathewaya histolytica]|uniref:Serine/threonine kinase n=2 Tax=Hathewaya histolytica TaxID=1498 RepID=A0A4U9QXD1_HATHI|nr:serine/threonine kinase [Hathewaya histolytica]
MGKKKGFSMFLDSKGESYLKKGKYLGCGHNGIVYILPKNRIVKFFNDENVCAKEYSILKRTRKSKCFPKVYDCGKNYIVRDFVNGHRLDHYIKENGITKELSYEIFNLIKEFKRLKFKKLDIRCKDIYILDKKHLVVIDPKNNYSKSVLYPRHLMKGLNKLGVLDEFLEFIKEINKETYEFWKYRMNLYLEKNIK